MINTEMDRGYFRPFTNRSVYGFRCSPGLCVFVAWAEWAQNLRRRVQKIGQEVVPRHNLFNGDVRTLANRNVKSHGGIETAPLSAGFVGAKVLKLTRTRHWQPVESR